MWQWKNLCQKGKYLMITDQISVKVDPALKNNATKIFKKIGISESEAIRLFLSEVVIRQQLPFKPRQANEKTLETMRKTDAGEELTEYKDISDFYREMGI